MPNMKFLDIDKEEAGPSREIRCQICKKLGGQYTCPRCNLNYCSVTCYQSETHSDCSEDFYRRCVLDEMKLDDGDPDAEVKMKEILRRLQDTDETNPNLNELDSDGESEPDLAERLTNIDLDDPDSIWEKLTPSEKEDFENLVNSGDASELLPTWKPWWNYRKEKKLIVEVGSEPLPSDMEQYAHNCPPIPKDVKPLSHITKTHPAEVVKYNLLNVLGAYCHMVRWFNGDHKNFTSESVRALTTLSSNLSHGNNYACADLAIESVALEASSCGWLGGCQDTEKTMRQDLACIVAGPTDDNPTFYLLAALSDIHALLGSQLKSKAQSSSKRSAFSQRFPDTKEEFASPALSKDLVKLCAKKIEYYLSWTLEHGTEICYKQVFDDKKIFLPKQPL